jgi:PAS domain S-box-containing protein
VRGGLLHALGTRNVYVTFYPAVVLAALYGGLRAGLLATLLSAFIVDYFWIEPSGLAIGDPADWLGVGVFVLGGTMISAVAEAMHRAQTRARVAEAEAHRAAARQQQQETLRQANAALRTANEELEQHVAERTAVVREQSRFLEAFYEHSLDSLVILDRQFNFIRVNEAYARECGRAVADFPGHNHFEFYPHAENQAIFENVVRTKVRHQVNAKPFVFPDHPEWGVIYRDWTLAPILDAQGEVDFLVFSLRDVTERNRAEAELARYRNHLEELIRVRTSELETTNTDLQAEIAERRRVEAQLRLQLAVLQSTANAIVVTGRDGTIEWVNAAFTQLTGYTAAEAVGRNPRVLNSGRQEAAFFAGMWQRILAGRVWHGELVNKRKDGSFYAEEMTITPVMGDQDQVAHFIAVKQDITARKQAEEGLRQTAEELVRSNEELEQFAYVASHDLQEPLRAVAGYLGLIEARLQDRLDDKSRHHIDGAIQGATRMHTLITDLLSLSRVGTRARVFETTDLNPVLDQALQSVRDSAEQAGARITRDRLPTLEVDAVQMTQLLQNLLANAIKFRGEQPPEIHVVAKLRADGQWQFAVRDNGIGIEPQYFQRIFLIFQRLHTRKEYPGTGIGLALCKKIIERHGGRIWVESEPGQGSTFYFTIPNQRTP